MDMTWIRTDDMKPRTLKWVIAAVRNSKRELKSRFAFRTDEKWFGNDDLPLDREPEYWMPMPEPPEEG